MLEIRHPESGGSISLFRLSFITMDLKGIAWVAHMYQKFENICFEVEEIMYEDTVNYVENQVQIVGKGVKKFYSDVLQDLLPPSITEEEPVKVGTMQLTEDGSVIADGKLYKHSNLVISKDPVKDLSRAYSFHESLNEDGKAGLDQLTEDCNVISGGKLYKPSIINKNSKADLSRRISFCESFNEDGKAEFEQRAMASSGDSVGEADISNGFEDSTEPNDRTDDFNMDADESSEASKYENEMTDLDLLRNNLEDSCVMVDEDNELGFVSHKGSRKTSYKKKIRKALFSRKSSRKQEYKELAEQYEDLDTRSHQQIVSSLTPNPSVETDSANLTAHNFFDPDWELL